MSVDVNTDLGKLRLCEPVWLLWCPVCEDWERLSVEQFEGRVSVNHAATGCTSGYHETHDFGREVRIKVAVHRLAPYDVDPVVRS